MTAPAPGAAPQPGAAPAPAAGHRLSDIDWMRGLAILIMPMFGLVVLKNAEVVRSEAVARRLVDRIE